MTLKMRQATKTDIEIIERIKETNDLYWFGILYDSHARAVYNKCLLFIHNKPDAEDLTHDIFLKVFISLKEFRGQSQFKTWLFTLTYNFCISFLRKKSRMTYEPDYFFPDHETETEVDDNEFLRLRIIQLEWALQEITAEEKMILFMKYQDDMSVSEIQDALTIGESAVKMRIKRAKKRVMELCNSNKML